MMQSERVHTQSAVPTRDGGAPRTCAFADRQVAAHATIGWHLTSMLALGGVVLLLRCSGVGDPLFALGGLLLIASHVASVHIRERLLARLQELARRDGLGQAAAAERAERELAAMAELVNGSRSAAELAYQRLPPPYLA